jgi:hypothetical protein
MDYHLDEIKNLTNITSLDIYDCISLHEKLYFLNNLTNLQTLSLPFGGLDDNDLQHLSLLSNLISLDLSQNYITGTGFVKIKLNGLKKLTVQRTNINIDGIKVICQSFPNLEEFIFSSASHNEVFYLPLSGQNKISCNNSDNYLNTDFNNDCLIELCNNFKHLKFLSLNDVAITNYNPLKQCIELEKLVLYHTECPSNYKLFPSEIPSDNYPYIDFYSKLEAEFPILPKINSLHFCKEFSEIVMPNIHLYSSLEDLNINSLKNDLVKSNIEKIPNLKKLCVHAFLQNDDVAVFKNLSKLEMLDLSYNHDLDDSIFNHLTNLSGLKCLNTCGTNVTQNNIP